MLSPVDLLGAKGRAHVRDEHLSVWDHLVGEFNEFESLNSFVITVVEKRGFFINVPVFKVR
jgi:hypothetical protein